METRFITKFRIVKLSLETHEKGSAPAWSFKPLSGEEYHEFDSAELAHEWIADNPEIMIRCREFTILPVYHLVLA